MFEGAVAERNGAGARIAHGEGVSIQAENAGDASVGDHVAFAIRPEKVRVSSRDPGSSAANALAGEIYDIAYLGDMTVYYVRLESGQVVKAAMLNSARLMEDPLTWDDHAWITFAPDAGVVLTR
jgi:putrescine transport system ATP-binding protein